MAGVGLSLKALANPSPLSLPGQMLESMERQTVVEWDRRCVAEARAGLLLERQVDKKRKELQKQLAAENRQLAMEQKARWDWALRLVYMFIVHRDLLYVGTTDGDSCCGNHEFGLYAVNILWIRCFVLRIY